MSRMGMQPLVEWKGMRGGKHLYRSTPEDEGVNVMVTYIEGIPQATVLEGEDEGAVFDPRGEPGSFERVIG